MYENWKYNEFRQVGKDYGNAEEVAVYDSSHADFRDVEKENRAVLEMLGLAKDSVLIDFGAGTGALAIAAARHCRQVFAVDVSQAMLDCASGKAKEALVENLEFVHAGYLSFEFGEAGADAVNSSLSLHHLPDFWKGIALGRIARMLKPGGRFLLRDVVLPDEDASATIAAFIQRQDERGGTFLREDAEEHFREEYSTFDWVMRGLLERSGFRLLSFRREDGVFATYLLEREGG